MTFLSNSGRLDVAPGARVNALTFRAGDLSCAVVQSLHCNFELMPDGSSHGVYLTEGSMWTINSDDLKKIPSDTMIRVDVLNTDAANTGQIAFMFMGVI